MLGADGRSKDCGRFAPASNLSVHSTSSRYAGARTSCETERQEFAVRVASVRSAVPVLVAGLLWAIVYSLVWGVAWFAFMRSAWYDALADGNRQMPWTEIWTIWAVLNVPLGMATAAYLRQRERVATESKGLIAVVLVLWVPMTAGMTGWAWSESLSLALIAIDSAVNLVGLAIASLLARAIVRGQQSQHTVPAKS